MRAIVEHLCASRRPKHLSFAGTAVCSPRAATQEEEEEASGHVFYIYKKNQNFFHHFAKCAIFKTKSGDNPPGRPSEPPEKWEQESVAEEKDLIALLILSHSPI